MKGLSSQISFLIGEMSVVRRVSSTDRDLLNDMCVSSFVVFGSLILSLDSKLRFLTVYRYPRSML